MRPDAEIDAIASLDDDRGSSALGDIKNKGVPGAKVLGLIVVLALLVLMGVLAYKLLTRDAPAEDSASAQLDTGVRNQMPGLRRTETPPPPPIVPEIRSEPAAIRPATQPVPVRQQAAAGAPVKTAAQLLRERRLLSELSDGNMRNNTATDAQATTGVSAQDSLQERLQSLAAHNAPPESPRSTSMADQLSPVRLAAASAGQIGSMDLLLLQSAMIDCALNTRVDSTTVPGMMSCDATRDIYSSNGRTVLLDRGTRFTGRYERGITRGQPRIFVVWERAVTPHGVVIDLDSPGTDQLGGSGLPGNINYRFWRRFGSAILISVFEDAGDYAVARANRNSNGTYIGNTTRSASDNAALVLQHNINLPPTLTKRHGDRVNIFVARDLDFSAIYDLRRRH